MTNDQAARLRAKLLCALCQSKPTLSLTMRPAKAVDVLEVSGEDVDDVVAAINKIGVVTVRATDVEWKVAAAVDAKPSDDVTAVFEHWRDKTTGRAKMTPARKRAITARLREGYTVDQLTSACDELFRSDFHVDGGYTDVLYFAGSTEKLDRLLAAVKKTEDAKPTAQMDEELRRILRAQRQRNR